MIQRQRTPAPPRRERNCPRVMRLAVRGLADWERHPNPRGTYLLVNV